MPTSTTARSTCRRSEGMAGGTGAPRRCTRALSLPRFPFPTSGAQGFWGGGHTHLLLEEDVEGHEREEAEVAGHGDTAAVVLWTGLRQSSGPLQPLCWGRWCPGMRSTLWVYSPTWGPLPCPPTSPLAQAPWSPPAGGRGARSAW